MLTHEELNDAIYFLNKFSNKYPISATDIDFHTAKVMLDICLMKLNNGIKSNNVIKNEKVKDDGKASIMFGP